MTAYGGPAARVTAVEPVKYYGPEDMDTVRALVGQARKRGGGPLSERTVEAIAETVSLYWSWRDSHGMEDSPAAVMAWFADMRERYATATVQNRFYLFKTYLFQRARGLEERRMVMDLLTGIQRHGSRPVQAVTDEKYLKVPELKDLVRTIEQPGTSGAFRLGLIVRALFYTGARVSELVGIRLLDCKRVRGVVKITLHGKGRKDRIVEIPGALFDTIRRRFKGERFLFEEDGKGLSRFAVTRRIERAGMKIGLHLSAHTIRHTRAMDLKERGLSADRTAKYLGHSNPATTFTYYYHGNPGTEEIGTLEAGIFDC